ncbi:MAG: MraY family glycosyltransferase [Planctomycetota bacterium]
MEPTQHERLRGESLIRVAFAILLGVSLSPPVTEMFGSGGHRWFRILVVSFAAAGFLTPLARGFARSLGHVDLPDPRKIHARPTPLFGGFAVWAGVLLSLAVNGIFGRGFEWILAGGTLLFCVGIADEARGIPARLKLLAQIAAALIVMAGGGTLTLFPAGALGTVANHAVTLVWILGITNAMNFIDGMDGLAAGLSTILALFLGIVAFQTRQPEFGWFSVAVIGACLGFLPYNFRRGGRPATVFLGDGGSTFLGFTLASLAVLGDWADNRPIVSFSNPILIFGVLIYDMTQTTIARIATGKVRSFREWLEYTGRDHIHHRFAALLRDRRQAVFAILLLSVTLGLAALGLRTAGNREAIFLVLQGALVLVLVTILEQGGKGLLAKSDAPPDSPPSPPDPGTPPPGA